MRREVLGAVAALLALSAPAGAEDMVSMGSSFAAGPGVGRPADDPPTRCARSADNYAHQAAQRLRLSLKDVSCGGARTEHVLSPWRELPAQIDAVDASTRIVIVTVGGNDVGYIPGLGAASCALTHATAPPTCPEVKPATDADFQRLEGALGVMIAEIRRRAPAARVILIDYPPVLPETGTCEAVPLTPEAAEAARSVAARLAAATAAAAKTAGAERLAMSVLARGHDACAKDPWMNGYPVAGRPVAGAPYHPNLRGMTATADALEALLRAR